MSEQDYKNWTIAKLCSELSQNGVSLPTTKQQKNNYIALYEEKVLGKAPTDIVSTTPIRGRKSVSVSGTNTSTRKRRRITAAVTTERGDKSESEDSQAEEPEAKKNKQEYVNVPTRNTRQSLAADALRANNAPDVAKKGLVITGVDPQATDRRRKTLSDSVAPQEDTLRRRQTVAPSSNYVAPSSNYVAPPSNYVAPPSNYVAPPVNSVAPPVNNDVSKSRKSYGFVNPALLNEHNPQYTQPTQSEPSTLIQKTQAVKKQPIVQQPVEESSEEEEEQQVQLNRSLTPSQVDTLRKGEAPENSSIPLKLLTLLLWGLVAYALYLYLNGRPKNTPPGGPYCNSEPLLSGEIPNCQPCPEHGYCDGGKLIACEDGYIKSNAICVKDKRSERVAVKMAELMQTKLSTQRGLYECQKAGVQPPTVLSNDKKVISYPNAKGMTISEVRSFLADRFLSVVHDESRQLLDEKSFNASFQKFIQLLRASSKNFELDFEPNADSSKEDVIYSTNPSIPFYCRVVRKCYENAYFLIGSFLLLCAVLIGNALKKKHDQERLDLEDLIRIVITRIKDKGRLKQLVLKADLKEQFSDIDVDKLWPKVCSACGEDPRLGEETNVEDYNLMWTWKQSDAPVDAPLTLNQAAAEAAAIE
ncbi:inner nuclear membrane protein SRC1-like [Acrasis kona]|uniref:Inner nuclear membrane protein SRC1-like n=1 Tax=Acrasis kona TaxID=1008807 RepID=A0AAW2ZI48_9EUKA